MPVKDFILLIVYLLVPPACNFAKKTPSASELRQSHLKEGKHFLKATIMT